MTRTDPPQESSDPAARAEGASGRAAPVSGPSSAFLRRLSDATLRATRYEIKGEIARGGMGTILRVHDPIIGRDLAMKVVLGVGGAESDEAAAETQSRYFARFLEEAQITGQLDHPGILPVHELGVDEAGRLYFTMKLVKGRELRAIFDLVRERREGWSRTRALATIQKVCEAVAFAHSKGVVHRDIKPANVMVGEFGEVYVMDWGLARASGRADKSDVRLRADDGGVASIRTERRREKEESSDSPLVTMDGDVVGTPCYMAPEQALGKLAELGPRSDVYSVGAMLYELLAGEMPYVPHGAKLSSHTVLALVIQGPPKRLLDIDETIPEELVAICEKAMNRDASRRYADTLAMAEDLRAFLENRVVAAHATGAVAELRKWFARNKALAVASSAALLLALGGLAAVLYVQSQRRRDAEQKNDELTQARQVALDNQALAERKAEDVLRLSAIQDLQDLVHEADELWPVEPSKIPAYERWLARAQVLADGLQGHRERLAEIRTRASSSAPRDSAAPAVGFDGLWSTNVGLLSLRVDGDSAVGVYMPGNTRAGLEGRVVGRRLEFRYSEPGTDGTGWFELAEAGDAFTGQYKASRSTNWSPWTGRRQVDAPNARLELANAGFEDGTGLGGHPLAWNDVTAQSGANPRPAPGAGIAVDTTVVLAGAASARFDVEPQPDRVQRVLLIQWIDAARHRGKRLELSGFMKTELDSGSAGLCMRIDNDLGVLVNDVMPQRALFGKRDWQRISIVLDVPPSATRMQVGALVFGLGTVWVDELALRVVGDDVPVTMASRAREAELAAMAEMLSSTRSWSFASTEDRWWHNQLEQLVDDLTQFSDPKSGLIGGSSPAHGLGIGPRLEFAHAVAERTTTGKEARRRWEEAIASIANGAECPFYEGLVLRPQLGLLPIGRDPSSGLWEFAHLLSGEPARRIRPDPHVRLRPTSGLVFVLIPGGEVTLGAQRDDCSGEECDPNAQQNEVPRQRVVLEPFFLSKYEMTQRQWQRITGENPSNYEAGTRLGKGFHTALHPVEQVSWVDCERTLQRMSLVLPTEAQWEYACRGGTRTPWWTGATVASLQGAANLPDESVRGAGLAWQEGATIEGFDDGYVAHAPVDAYRPNPFGLHNVHGNVWEWCRDWLASYELAVRPGDGERASSDATTRVVRGGSFNYGPERARSSNRFGQPPSLRVNSIGVRPARAIDP